MVCGAGIPDVPGRTVLCPYSTDISHIHNWSETCCGSSLCKLRSPLFSSKGMARRFSSKTQKNPFLLGSGTRKC